MVRANRIMAIVILILTGVLAYNAMQFKLMAEFGPGPGFWPAWLAVAWGVLGVLWFLESGKAGKESFYESRWAAVRAPVIMLIFLGYVLAFERIGLIPSTFLFLLTVTWLYEKRSFVSSLITAAAIPVGLHLLFVTFLGVDLPGGPLMP